MSRVVYRIRVVGHVPDRFFEDFSGVSVAAEDVGITLLADLADQAELHGVLSALRREGLALLELREQPVDSGEDPSGDAVAGDDAPRDDDPGDDARGA